MENTQKLARLIAEHPNAKIMPMISCDINMHGDFSYRCADIEDCEYAEITIYHEDGIMYKKDDIEVLVDNVMEVEHLGQEDAKNYIENGLDWSPVILVWIFNIQNNKKENEENGSIKTN